ncbi:DUF362 domain-containing protein [Aurantiacibacter poecillastricola]|uniref:DUF362 domain-containing protein n=1 Tax=Aurantiacibacter poecillastricola TaxID=3064385 RepID=UPI00273E547E|nr:DUF362 domain-containing protein [Aurantiacibacter sp. 219JJ12-13]MDP5261561.1 DUF362 domain-containing protein [Aurantiacibacter sp. 219JJ12-13]
MTSAAATLAVVTDDAASPTDLLDRAASAIGFARMVKRALRRKGNNGEVIVVPAMDGFASGSPAIADPALVEHLIDRLYDLGASSVRVGATEGSDALWAENRDVFMRADLLGYRYFTPAGREYDIVDLAEDAKHSPFAAESVLAGISLSAALQKAAFRIVFAANRTDTADGYALTLQTLLSVLPGRDKESLYFRQRDPGAVITALLDAVPIDAAFIDAYVSSHGHGGGARPLAFETRTIIAASDPLVADQAGALKMGLDPQASRLWHAPPADVEVRTSGSVLPYDGWVNVTPIVREAARRRQKDAALDRSVRPFLQQVDTSLFPFRNEANARINTWIEPFLSVDDATVTGRQVFALLEMILAQIAEGRAAWQILFAKDAITRRPAALNVRAQDIDEDRWAGVSPTIASQRALLSGCTADAEGLRWRMVDGAVLFDCVRRYPVPFDAFVAAVPVHRTIQFMNDYIGGEAATLASDEAGRVTRQLERNLYLPQPNFTVLLGGDIIDVTKIETVHYAGDRHVMAWQTLLSANGSALADDGLVEFAAVGDDTVVAIFARQHFRQPPLVEAFDLTLLPDLHAWLVTDAYRRFASRTFANLEAVLEGRDVRIGKPAAQVGTDEPLPIDGLLALAERLRNELPDDWIESLRARFDWTRKDHLAPDRIDAHGFRHFKTVPQRSYAGSPTHSAGSGAAA